MLDLTSLTPTQFENLAYDLLQVSGMSNLVWRTPGPDGGRDLEGNFLSVDFSGGYYLQKWYIECKFYSSAVDWPTIWKKIAYAEARGADFLLLLTNSNPSPNAESEIALWNANSRRVALRVWRGYELEHMLHKYPIVASKYGLTSGSADVEWTAQPLIAEVMKIAQTIYTSHRMGADIERPVEASATLSELIEMRLDQLRNYGRFLETRPTHAVPQFDWLVWSGEAAAADEAGMRAFLCMLRFLFCATRLNVKVENNNIEVQCTGARIMLSPKSQEILREVSVWAGVQLGEVDGARVEISGFG